MRSKPLSVALACGVAATALLATAGAAQACRCAVPRPSAEASANSPGFIGRVVSKRLVSSANAPMEYVYTYRVAVERRFRRRLGRRIRIASGSNEGMCGFEWRKGERVAGYLNGRRGRWRTSLCQLREPSELKRGRTARSSRCAFDW